MDIQQLMLAQEAPSATRWDACKAWVIGLTGVLIVVPALINSAWDVYATLRHLPRTSEEREQQALFLRYLGKQPLGTYEIPVRSEAGPLTYRLLIYSGHIFSQFGDRTFWFPIAQPPRAAAGWFPAAHAQEPVAPADGRSYVLRNRYEDGLLVMEQLYADGSVLRLRLDPKTGRILSRDRATGGKPYGGTDPQTSNQVIQLPPIDVKGLKQGAK